MRWAQLPDHRLLSSLQHQILTQPHPMRRKWLEQATGLAELAAAIRALQQNPNRAPELRCHHPHPARQEQGTAAGR
ncbi:MAG: hypothetical protein WCK86_09460 [Planctomycetia bacterium]